MKFQKNFKPVFFDRMKEGKDDTIEGRLLELADKLDQVYEAFAELQRGNTDIEFVNMYETALRKILHIPLNTSIDYFKEVILQEIMKEESVIDVKSITVQLLVE